MRDADMLVNVATSLESASYIFRDKLSTQRRTLSGCNLSAAGARTARTAARTAHQFFHLFQSFVQPRDLF